MWVLEDLKYAFRLLGRQPGFSIVAILILAGGLGANGAIFSLVRHVLLKPLPYPDADALYYIWERNDARHRPRSYFSASGYAEVAAQATSFSHVSASRVYAATWTGQGQARRVTTLLVSRNYFDVLGVRLSHGRTFTPEECSSGRGQFVVLSYEFWRTWMAGDPKVLGRTIVLEGEPHEIVGVLPDLKGAVSHPDLYLPDVLTPQQAANRDARYLTVLGRLRPGATMETAAQELKAVAAQIAAEHPDSEQGWDIYLTRAQEELTAPARAPLKVLAIAVGLVLLIACANLAGLLLVRASARQKEIAVRAALGASQWRVFRQMITESVVLSAVGGLAGVAVAWWTLRLIVARKVATLPRLEQARLDWPALGFTLALALLCGLLFGCVPAWRILRINPVETLREEGRGGGGSVRRSLTRSVIVVAEVALSAILLAGAGLLLRTFHGLSQIDPGFRAEGVLTCRTTLPDAGYPTPAARALYVRRLLDRLNSIPGVRAAGVTTALPMMQVNWMADFTLPGRPGTTGQKEFATYNAISPRYLEALGAHLVKGRNFTERDDAASPSVVLISEAFEKAYFGGRDPIGQSLWMKVSRFEFQPTIVGVVRDIRHLRLDEPPRIAIYQPFAQLSWPFLAFAVESELSTGAASRAVRDAFAQVDPEVPADRISTLGDLVDDVLAQQRLAMTLLTVFSAVAVALSAIGLYGILAIAVTQRAREFGVRMALGSSSAGILRLVLAQGLLLTLAGLLAGLVCAPMATRVMESMLYGVKPADPLTFAFVALLLLVVAAGACALPAWRASRIDPACALRTE
jgi:putative ABC transport system permease protein